MENWKDFIPANAEELLEAVTAPVYRVKNWLNAHQFPSKGERNVLPSLTVPDQSLSIPELIARQSAGLPLTGARVPIFDPLDTLPDMRTLDLAEIADLRERFAKEYNDIIDEANAEILAKKAQKEADDRQRVIDIYNEQMAAGKTAAEKSTNPS